MMIHPKSQSATASPLPVDVHCAADYERLARQRIDAPTFAYLSSGSGEGVTLAANRAAFDAWSIYPRVLRDVSQGSTSVSLAGERYPHPVFLAPVAYQSLLHPRGELESARGAAAVDACTVVSTLSSSSLEDVAAVTPGRKWFQLYFQPRREYTLDLVRRAEGAGYGALVVTLDAAIQLPGVAALRAGFRMPVDCIATNLVGYAAPDPSDAATAGSRIFQGVMRAAPTWNDLDWLMRQTKQPVWAKGVLHRDDARQLQERGVTGIVVSNHGGRTLDHAPASIDALPAIRAAVGPGYPLIIDSGIRSGADIYKAIALGADAVMVGRLQVYALAVAGALGVAHMLRLLREEFEVCMAMTGCASLADIRNADGVSRLTRA